MKFYNREKELAALEKVRQTAFSNHSQMTVLTGRRRIGVGQIPQEKPCEPDCQRLGLYAYEPDFQGCKRTSVRPCGQHHEVVPFYNFRVERNISRPQTRIHERRLIGTIYAYRRHS